MTTAFTFALYSLRRDFLTVQNLTIHFHPFSFGNNHEFLTFAHSLRRVNITGTLALKGSDWVLKELPIRDFVEILGMNTQPQSSIFDHAQLKKEDDGFYSDFSDVYKPAAKGEDMFQQPGQIINDAKSKYLSQREVCCGWHGCICRNCE